jgi:hypothetical protein
MLVLHCNGRTYGNAYLITFNLRPLRTHTLAPLSLPLLEAPAEGFFWSSAVAFDLIPSQFAKRVPLRPILRVGISQKSLGARSGEHGDWVMTGIAAQQAIVCLGALW